MVRPVLVLAFALLGSIFVGSLIYLFNGETPMGLGMLSLSVSGAALLVAAFSLLVAAFSLSVAGSRPSVPVTLSEPPDEPTH